MSEEHDKLIAEFQYLKASLKPRMVTFAIGRAPVEGKTCLYCETVSVHAAHGLFRNAAQVEFPVVFHVCVLCGQPYTI